MAIPKLARRIPANLAISGPAVIIPRSKEQLKTVTKKHASEAKTFSPKNCVGFSPSGYMNFGKIRGTGEWAFFQMKNKKLWKSIHNCFQFANFILGGINELHWNMLVVGPWRNHQWSSRSIIFKKQFQANQKKNAFNVYTPLHENSHIQCKKELSAPFVW